MRFSGLTNVSSSKHACFYLVAMGSTAETRMLMNKRRATNRQKLDFLKARSSRSCDVNFAPIIRNVFVCLVQDSNGRRLRPQQQVPQVGSRHRKAEVLAALGPIHLSTQGQVPPVQRGLLRESQPLPVAPALRRPSHGSRHYSRRQHRVTASKRNFRLRGVRCERRRQHRRYRLCRRHASPNASLISSPTTLVNS